MIEQFLLQVRKPGRYIGGEWNVIKKNPKVCNVKFALCFPDLYELGMSYLGLRIIYGLLNEQDNVLCERVFALGDDFEEVLRANNILLFSLENRIALKDFDIVGFSLTYELNYTNVLNMLELGGIPVFSRDRLSGNYPLIITGGNCTLNPEPMADFFDLFLIGDGEEAILEIVEVYKNNRNKKKQELLEGLSKIEGVYVPCLGRDTVVKKRIVKDLNTAYFPKSWIVPFIGIVHDRLSLEIARGCPNKCRFCQARVYYWPYREKRIDLLKAQAVSLYKNTGYEEISLLGLSASDYSHLDELVRGLHSFCDEHKIALSFPSIRPKILVSKLTEMLAKIKKTTITFAPETASSSLCDFLNKNLKIEELIETSQELFKLGYLHIKLYFMVGLPGETNGDLDKIVELCATLLEARKKLNNRRLFLNLSISNFIPKPHTVFERLGFEEIASLREKHKYLKTRLSAVSKNIKLSFHNIEKSALEAVLSRGDRALARVIFSAWKSGVKFDSWEDRFNFSLWDDAFKREALDLNKYLQKKNIDEALPWGFIHSGIPEEDIAFNN